MLSRTETGYKIVIIMTRWATGDLAGRALEHWPDAELITMKAMAGRRHDAVQRGSHP